MGRPLRLSPSFDAKFDDPLLNSFGVINLGPFRTLGTSDGFGSLSRFTTFNEESFFL